MARRLCVLVIAAVIPLIALAGEGAHGGGTSLRPGVYSIRLDGSDRRALGFRADFVAAGSDRRILFLDGSQLGVARDDGSRRQILGRFRPWPGAPYAAWSPDGRWIAVFGGKQCDVICESATTWIVSSRSGTVRRALPGCVDPAWSHDGGSVACWRYVGFDGTTDQDLLDVYVFRLRDGYGRRVAHGCCPHWLSGHELVYRPQDGGWLHVIRSDGTDDRALRPGSLYSDWGFAPSPDGTSVAVIASRERPFWDAGVYVTPIDGTGARPLDKQPYTYGQTGAWSLSWSPDGKLVAWVIGREWVRANGTSDSDQVLLAPSDGSQRRRQVTHESGGAAIDSVALSSDGTRAIYTVR